MAMSLQGDNPRQGQCGLPLQGTNEMSSHTQLCSLLGPEASVSSWLDWRWVGSRVYHLRFCWVSVL